MNTPLFYLDPDSSMSLQNQIRAMLIEAILNGTLAVGVRLPSSRQLAKQLNVARNTVISAYQQLVDEGYLLSRERSGCYINPDILKGRVNVDKSAGQDANQKTGQADTAINNDDSFWRRRLRFKEPIRHSRCYPANWLRYPYPFIDGQFDPDLFPVSGWRECVKITQNIEEIYDWAADCGKQDDSLLVDQIRTKLLSRRGISAQPDEILVTLGSQQALFVIAHMLFNQNSRVGVECPGYADAANLFNLYTRHIEYLDIDEDGLVLSDRLSQCDFVYTTPSHQYPTTATLSMPRRQALLEQAAAEDFVIIEDDYACEVNYQGEPKPALKSLDKAGRVIYVSSLSKLLAPGLRLGFMVAPRALIQEARALRRLMLQHPPINNQRAAALFLSLGHYDALIRKLNVVHEERWYEMRRAVNDCFPQPHFMITKAVGGTACWIQGPSGLAVAELVEQASKRGILLESEDTYMGERGYQNCFRLSITSISTERIRPGVEQLAELIRQMLGDGRETLATAIGDVQSIDDLSRILPGSALMGMTAYGEPYTVTLAADGTMQGVAGEAHQERDSGKWWFADGLWWRCWESWNYGDTRGFKVVLDGRTIKWFDPQGDLVDTDLLIIGGADDADVLAKTEDEAAAPES